MGYCASGRHVPLRFPANPTREAANPSAWHWEDLRQAPELGWHAMVNRVKAGPGLAGICAVIILLDTATDVLADSIRRLLTAVPHVTVGADTSNGVFAVVDQPVRSYIACVRVVNDRAA